MRFIQISKARRSVKSMDDEELRDAKRNSAFGAGVSAAGLGMQGAFTRQYAREAKNYGETENYLRRRNYPYREAMRNRKYSRNMALAHGGLAAASAGLTGLTLHDHRKARREMYRRGM
jgi:hypothetical protein